MWSQEAFQTALIIPVNEKGAEMCRKVVLNSEEDRITWTILT